MFLKNRKGMEVLQMIILGLLIVALGIAFVTRFQDGVKSAGESVNGAMTTVGGTLENSVAGISP